MDGQVRTSSQAIDGMRQTLRRTEARMEATGAGIDRAIAGTGDWTDAKGDEYRDVLRRVRGLALEPRDTLRRADASLGRLSDAVRRYEGVRF